MINHEFSQGSDENRNDIFERLVPPLSRSETSENGLSIFSVYGEGTSDQVTENIMGLPGGGTCRARSFPGDVITSETFDSEGVSTIRTTQYPDGMMFIEAQGTTSRVAPNGDMFLVESGGTERQIARGTDTVSLEGIADGIIKAAEATLDTERQRPSIPLSLFVDDFSSKDGAEK